MKGLGLFAFFVLAVSLLAGTVSAQAADFVTIDHVKVNGMAASPLSPIFLERGQQVFVEVFFRGTDVCVIGDANPCYDARVEVEIQGYEHGEVRDVEGPFEVEPGVQYRKLLSFMLPDDIQASDDVNLNLEVKHDDGLVFLSFPVRIQEQRHSVNVFDVIFNPQNNARAGQPFFTTVRLENLGDNTEGSVRVNVAVPALGIQTSEFVDRLNTFSDNDGDDAATTNDLLLFIPENAAEGDYDVVVSIEYNRGFDVNQRTFTMHVLGAQPVLPADDVEGTRVVVNVESETLSVETGEGAVYRFSVANLGQSPSTFNFELSNTGGWANTRVDPASVTVQPDQTKEVFVFVVPNEGTLGPKAFNLRVLSNGDVLSDVQLVLNVLAPKSEADAKTVFTWIFAVLLAILVILVVVVLAKKMVSKEGKGIEGQTYY